MTVTRELDVVQRLLTDKPSFHLSGTAYWDATPGTLDAVRRLVRPGDVKFEVGADVSTVVFAAAGARAISSQNRQLCRDEIVRVKQKWVLNTSKGDLRA